MLLRLLVNFMGAPDVARDLDKREEEGHTVYYSEDTDSWWVPAETLNACINAEPGSLESMMTRRLASLREWDDQHPSEWFSEVCPGGDNGFMHRIDYPAISGLSFHRRDGQGIWITNRMLERILIHDKTTIGAATDKPVKKKKKASADAPMDGEGNEVESGVGGNPAEKGAEGTVDKVWIIPGCIVCDLCEEISPDVFKVTEETSTVQMASQNSWNALSTAIIEAAVGCPVDVIKYELKAS